MAVMALALAALLLGTTPHAHAVDEFEVTTAVEAWYRSSAVAEDEAFCILPCPPVPLGAEPRPEDTLHVGVMAGRETARTYFTLDLSAVPDGATVIGGRVELPVAGEDSGTAGAEQASIVACAVRGIVVEAEGGPPQEAPQTDCSFSAPAELDSVGVAFVFDLLPFLSGSDDISVALVPSQTAREESATWRVAFHGRERATPDAVPITGTVTYTTPEESAPPPGAPDGARPVEAPFSQSPPVGGAASPLSFVPEPPETAAEPPSAAPGEPDARPPVLAAPVAPGLPAQGGHAYPSVWLLPLAFLGVGGLLGRSLAQDYEVEPAAVLARGT